MQCIWTQVWLFQVIFEGVYQFWPSIERGWVGKRRDIGMGWKMAKDFQKSAGMETGAAHRQS